MGRLRGSHQKNRDVSRLRDEVDNALGKVASEAASLPIGSITMFGAADAPEGWLICDGKEVSRGQYGELFNVIGTTFGNGDGASTFNLPDFRGNSPIGKKSLDNLGDAIGSASHTHTLSDDGRALLRTVSGSHELRYRAISGVTSWTDTQTITGITVAASATSNTVGTELAGSTDSGDSYHPSLVVHFIIYAGSNAAPV